MLCGFIYSYNIGEHIEHLGNHLLFNPMKCVLTMDDINFLSHMMGMCRVWMDCNKIWAIDECLIYHQIWSLNFPSKRLKNLLFIHNTTFMYQPMWTYITLSSQPQCEYFLMVTLILVKLSLTSRVSYHASEIDKSQRR